MIKSMTGFASVTHEDDRATVGVTIRSVNHRYLDMQVRVPQSLSQLEGRLRGCVQTRASRGRIEVAVSVQLRQEPTLTVALNDVFVAKLSAALEHARGAGLIEGSLQPGDLLRFPQALTVREEPTELDAEGRAALDETVLAAVERALEQLDEMRRHEGAMLQADLDARKTAVAAAVARIAQMAAAGEAHVRERLSKRVFELSSDVAVDAALIAQEVVRFAARSDISEETVRFAAHVAQWTTLTDGPEPCGRKLDFLLQEMNREVNTMGSKADGPGVPETVIGIKAELEKMREQVQNVE